MASQEWQTGAWDVVARLVAVDGSAGHAHVVALSSPGATTRDLSDAVHALCTVHGRHPGMADDALLHRAMPEASAWLEEVAEAFAHERGYIAQLASAAGPLPSTPGQASSETAIHGQRHAFEMLARSDRSGCATGAVAALAVDWRAIRAVLDRAAERFSITPPSLELPPAAETATMIAALGRPGPAERAIAFGAQQLLAQHRGLWDLLQARAGARDHA